MSCYHPLVGVWKGEKTANGKKKYEIDGNLNPLDCPSAYDHIIVPCGHCIGCRLDYSRSWADRMMLELETAGKGVFVTLTYNNWSIPCSQFEDMPEDLYLPANIPTGYDNNGVAYLGTGFTLDKRDCQLWMKRLRKKFENIKIRFYLAGEYGETSTNRPHYHVILFGIGLDDLPDLHEFGKNELGQRYYISPMLSETWSRGHVLVSDVSWKTCAYVARYVTKKLNGKYELDYAVKGHIKEFSLMSRQPGIGKKYLEEHPDCLDYENINISTPEGGMKIKIPKFYLNQLKYVPKETIKESIGGKIVKKVIERPEKNILYNKERYDSIMKERKEAAEDALILKLGKTSLSYLDYLEVEEEKKISQLKGLPKRNKVY